MRLEPSNKQYVLDVIANLPPPNRSLNEDQKSMRLLSKLTDFLRRTDTYNLEYREMIVKEVKRRTKILND